MNMRRIFIFLIVFFLFVNFIQAQVWFEGGGRVMYGATALFASEVNDNDNHSMNIETGLSFGPVFNINFSDIAGISTEVMFASGKQSYDFDGGGVSALATTNNIEWNSTDIYLLYRTMSRGAYLEIGPKLSLLSQVDQNVSNMGITGEYYLTPDLMDVSNMYTDQFFSGVLGFGMYVAGSKYFTVSLGFRIEYAFQNFTSSDGEDLDFPLPYEPTFESGNLRNINAYGGLEVRFPIGGIARAQCGQRRFIFGGG